MIRCNKKLWVDGVISSNADNSGHSALAGGGSGGSLLIYTKALDGTGEFQVDISSNLELSTRVISLSLIRLACDFLIYLRYVKTSLFESLISPCRKANRHRKLLGESEGEKERMFLNS